MEHLPFDALAYEIAQTLNDPDSLPQFKIYVETYPRQFLLDMLARTMSVPDHKVKKSRGALFVFLVQHNGTRHLRG